MILLTIYPSEKINLEDSIDFNFNNHGLNFFWINQLKWTLPKRLDLDWD